MILQYLHGKWEYLYCITTVLSNICQHAEDIAVELNPQSLIYESHMNVILCHFALS